MGTLSESSTVCIILEYSCKANMLMFLIYQFRCVLLGAMETKVQVASEARKSLIKGRKSKYLLLLICSALQYTEMRHKRQ